MTATVDLTRDEQGRFHARLIDVVPGRSGTAYANWLKDQRPEFIADVEHAALEPFRGYANAIRDELPDASPCSTRSMSSSSVPKSSTRRAAACIGVLHHRAVPQS